MQNKSDRQMKRNAKETKHRTDENFLKINKFHRDQKKYCMYEDKNKMLI